MLNINLNIYSLHPHEFNVNVLQKKSRMWFVCRHELGSTPENSVQNILPTNWHLFTTYKTDCCYGNTHLHEHLIIFNALSDWQKSLCCPLYCSLSTSYSAVALLLPDVVVCVYLIVSTFSFCCL